MLAVFQEPDNFAGDADQSSTGAPDLGRLFRAGIQDVNRLGVGYHTPCSSLHTTIILSQRAWGHTSGTVSLPYRGVAPSPAPAGCHPRCYGRVAGISCKNIRKEITLLFSHTYHEDALGFLQ